MLFDIRNSIHYRSDSEEASVMTVFSRKRQFSCFFLLQFAFRRHFIEAIPSQYFLLLVLQESYFYSFFFLVKIKLLRGISSNLETTI